MITTTHNGQLAKMETIQGNPVGYQLLINHQTININSLLGKDISIRFLNAIQCIYCGRKTEKSYFSGYCWPCFKTLPQTADCIFHPELCEAQNGMSRSMEWSEKFCLQPHVVYLALSSDIKVGVTRQTQIPTRWIDQGASQAIVLAETKNRFEAGIIEVALKKHLPDKTNWRIMLQNRSKEGIDLVKEKKRISALLSKAHAEKLSPNDQLYTFDYPVLRYPEKIKAIRLEKQAEIRSKLIGIKGQYLIFEDNSCINIRNHAGYTVELAY